ncbi:MAG TPA: hypothetical protein VGU01_05310 [Sphingomicrobium sp.]|nr:hypothetical protein [Sphingomicrobium sp.]
MCPLKRREELLTTFSMDRRTLLAALAIPGTPKLVRADTGGTSIVPPSMGLVGALHLPPDRARAPALLVLGGSEGGHATAYRQAQLLAGHGFAAFALAYFGEAGLPSTLENIPLEYSVARSTGSAAR